MQLTTLDWTIVVAFFCVTLAVGAAVARRAGESSSEFFLSGRSMPWWLLGTSMVATTFAADTPLLVTAFTRQDGVAGNWRWWAFLLTGMLTVFVYAKLWRRSGVGTDIEFYELRYSGGAAAFLRGFRALYLGVFFNVMIMGVVILAAVKIGRVLLGLSELETVLVTSLVTTVFSAMGGLIGVVLTDLLLFVVAMAGAVAAAWVALDHPSVGGLAGLLAHPAVQEKLVFVPSIDDWDLLVSAFVIPLAVQWWSVWYPGSEPGGGGFVAQRMLAARDERHATGATLLFNATHYALRPWPWIIVALCSLVVFPDVASLERAFPAAEKVDHDLAYVAMLTFLPPGVLGLVVASLVAAYMSTISTQLNWGSSYVVNDFYKRFLRPDASEEDLVRAGRVSTVVMMVLGAFVAIVVLRTVDEGFNVLLQIGAGTGLLFLLRWFWWRINPWSEIVAMVVSLGVALYSLHPDVKDFPDWMKLTGGVAITTLAWVVATLVTPPSDERTLRAFYRLARPGGPGWRRVVDGARAAGESIDAGESSSLAVGILCAAVGCVAVYAALFATGSWIYGRHVPAAVLTVTAVVATYILVRSWSKVSR